MFVYWLILNTSLWFESYVSDIMYEYDIVARSQWTDKILYLIILDFAKCGEIVIPPKRRSISPCIGAMFHGVSLVRHGNPSMDNAICPSVLFL